MTVATPSASSTTNYILDGQNVAQEWVDADSDEVMDAGEVVTYMAGPRGVECRIHYDTQQEKDVFRWYIYDGLGSVLSEVDDEGNVKFATTKYDVYGAAVSQEGSTASKHHFVGSLGHQVEPSTGGLIYMRARWYDPVTGRFISEDPAGDGVNWYAYCRNNPVNAVDETGRFFGLASLLFGSLDGSVADDMNAAEAEWAKRKMKGTLSRALENYAKKYTSLWDEQFCQTAFKLYPKGGFRLDIVGVEKWRRIAVDVTEAGAHINSYNYGGIEHAEDLLKFL